VGCVRVNDDAAKLKTGGGEGAWPRNTLPAT
jgi:hypothetical protein